MNASEQIRHFAPSGAHTYKVSSRLPTGKLHTVPEHSSISIGSPLPYGLAPGRYTVLYFDHAGALLDGGVCIQVDGRVEASALATLFDEYSKRATAAGCAPEYSAEPQDESDLESSDDEQDEDSEESGPGRGRFADPKAEAQMINMQLKVQRQQQTFIRDSAHTREVGETHQLNSFLRRDLIETHQLMLHNLKDQYTDFTSQRLKWDEDMQICRERYQARMAAMTPAPPPTDWAAPLSQFITAGQNVALAFFQAKNPGLRSLGAGESGGHTLPKVADPRDNDEVQTAKIASAPSGPPNPPAPPIPPEPPQGDPAALKRVKELLTQLSDIEVAAIASNPLALLEFIAPKKASG